MSVRVVALGGGHGLAASLAALRRVVSDLTAVVTVADNGGSSGRLRRERGVLAQLREVADIDIDNGELNVHQLTDKVAKAFGTEAFGTAASMQHKATVVRSG